MSDVHVTGLKELQALLDTLPAKLEANILRGALRAGAKVIKEQAKENLSSNGSVVSRALYMGLKIGATVKKGSVVASVKAKGRHAHIAHWLEYGVAAHGVKKGATRSAGKGQDGKLHPGFEEKPFLRPALDARADDAVVAAGNYIKKRLSTKAGLDTSGIDVGAES